MIEFTLSFLYGCAFGLLIMDDEDKAAYECEWGFVLMLGPVGLQFVKT